MTPRGAKAVLLQHCFILVVKQEVVDCHRVPLISNWKNDEMLPPGWGLEACIKYDGLLFPSNRKCSVT